MALKLMEAMVQLGADTRPMRAAFDRSKKEATQAGRQAGEAYANGVRLGSDGRLRDIRTGRFVKGPPAGLAAAGRFGRLRQGAGRLIGGIGALGGRALGGISAAAGAMGPMSGVVGAAGIGLAATAIIKAGATFEKSMNRVKALTQAAGDDFEALKDQAKELGRTTQFSASQSADAMSFLAMAGFDVNQIMGAMPNVLNLAAAGQMDIGRAADIASNIMSGMGMTTEELGPAIDVMARAFVTANTDLSMLGNAFKQVGPVGKAAGVSFEELTAAIQIMSNAGIQGGEAGTALRTMLQRIQNPSAEIKEGMEALGLTIADSKGDFVGLASVLSQIEEGTSKLTQTQKNQALSQLAGKKAQAGLSVLVAAGTEEFNKRREALNSMGLTAKSVAETQMEGLSGAFVKLQSATEGAFIAISETFQGSLTSMVESLTSFVSAVPEFISKLADMWAGLGDTIAITGINIGLSFLDMVPAAEEAINKIFAIVFGLTEGMKAMFQSLLTEAKNVFTNIGSILGAGGAGLSAAIQAIQEGKSPKEALNAFAGAAFVDLAGRAANGGIKEHQNPLDVATEATKRGMGVANIGLGMVGGFRGMLEGHRDEALERLGQREAARLAKDAAKRKAKSDAEMDDKTAKEKEKEEGKAVAGLAGSTPSGGKSAGFSGVAELARSLQSSLTRDPATRAAETTAKNTSMTNQKLDTLIDKPPAPAVLG